MLESERTTVKHHVETLQNTVGDIIISETRTKKHEEECERERQAQRILQNE